MSVAIYRKAKDVPAFVVATLERHAVLANTILPQLEKCRTGEVADEDQLWIIYTIDGEVTYVLSVTNTFMDKYPIFIFTTKPSESLCGQVFEDEMMTLAESLEKNVQWRRVYSVFAPMAIADEFTKCWSDLTGIPINDDEPYYDSYISDCTPESFVAHDRRPVPPNHRFEIRRAYTGDVDNVARLCKGFSEESVSRRKQEAEYLINHGLIWVYTTISPRTGRADIASILACTRNTKKVATITKVYTSEAWRGMGCAGRLVRQACRELFAQGKQSIALYVGVENGAQSVYRKVGFKNLDETSDADRWVEIGFEQEFVDLGHW
ncbi:hypothetical protein AMATHDRAFT_145063 [Amanita thiersii Skay4041]|uniref:N-acetyltransferase domain-containing protein n=1 Tax=Amanita thiersii Skay4041 TaxID=703135 RepID=A0A2A9NQ71_9AGAR|nr:hypothetical protein AMATHDRAFT_145063 [Amanita thiersii Skay4041]